MPKGRERCCVDLTDRPGREEWTRGLLHVCHDLLRSRHGESEKSVPRGQIVGVVALIGEERRRSGLNISLTQGPYRVLGSRLVDVCVQKVQKGVHISSIQIPPGGKPLAFFPMYEQLVHNFVP